MRGDMNREELFAQTLEQVRQQAKEQGNCVSEEQVREAFKELKLTEEQLKMVFDYLVKHKVGIGEPVDVDEYLTEEERGYLQSYMDEIAALPSYSQGQIEGYTIAAMAGETDAQALLTQYYLKDVVDIAKLYMGQGVLLEDLIGEGNLALTLGTSMLGSLEKPQEAQGMLAKMIMDAMEAHIRETAANEKSDQKVADKVNLVADKARELAQELNRKVTIQELAEETGFSEKSIRDAMRMSGFKIEEIDYAEDDI